MKDTKKCLVDFTFYDSSRIEKYLEKQSEKGWLLEKITSYIWSFRKVEAKKRSFSVVYFAKASEFDPEPSEEQLIFHDFCEHAGWKLVATNAQMQIFYSEEENATPIETDAELELESIHKSVKKSYLASHYITLAFFLWEALLLGGRILRKPLEILSNRAGLWCGLIIFIGIVWMLKVVADYYFWYHRAKKVVREEGRLLEASGGRNYTLLLILWAMLGLVLWLCSYNSYLEIPLGIFACVGVIACEGLVVWQVEKGKSEKLSAKESRNRVILATIGLSIGMGLLVILGRILIDTYMTPSKVSVGTYEYRDMTWEIYNDEIPLTIEDLMYTEYEQYTYEIRECSESALVKYKEAFQRPRVDEVGEYPDLYYTVVEVKFQPFYNWCLNSAKKLLEKEYAYRIPKGDSWLVYESIDAAVWGAEEAFQIVAAGEVQSHYILCYEGVIVDLRFRSGGELTNDMKGIVGEKLGGQ